MAPLHWKLLFMLVLCARAQRKMDFDRSQTAAIKEAFKSRTLPSRGLPQGSCMLLTHGGALQPHDSQRTIACVCVRAAPHSTLRDGDSYVMGSPTRDDDGWTWNSDIGSPVKRVVRAMVHGHSSRSGCSPSVCTCRVIAPNVGTSARRKLRWR